MTDFQPFMMGAGTRKIKIHKTVYDAKQSALIDLFPV